MGSFKNLTIGLIWLMRAGWGGGVGGWAREAGKGGAPESSVGARLVTRGKKPNNWSDLAGTRGGWAREAGKGGRWGGARESSVGATTGSPFSLKNQQLV